MSDESSEFPFTINYGDLVGEHTFNSYDDLLQFARHTLPDVLGKHKMAKLKEQEEEDDSTLVKFQSRIESGGGMHFSGQRREVKRDVPTRIGQLWDEEGSLLIDDKAEFELSFPRGRFVTGFVGTMKPSRNIPVPKSSLLWHDYLIDIPEKKFWRGRVMIQRRTDDARFNIRSHGMNEYMV